MPSHTWNQNESELNDNMKSVCENKSDCVMLSDVLTYSIK